MLRSLVTGRVSHLRTQSSTAEGNLTASLFKYITQQTLSVYIRLSFFVRQVTMTVRKFRSKTDDHTEGKSGF